MIDRTLRSASGLAVAASLLFGSGAFAAAEGGHEASPGLFTGDIGNIIWSLVTFFAVVLVLRVFAWKPILAGLKKREEYISDSLRQAKEDREQAEARLREYTEQLQKARDEATALVEEGRRDADVLRRKIESDARAEADAALERAKREIATARDTAVKELYQLTARLSTEVAGRVIRAELNETAHEKLIEESIEELSKLRGSSRN